MLQSSPSGAVFQGSFPHSVDAKGRVSLPSSYRAVLDGDDRVLVWPSFGASGDPGYLEGGRVDILSLYMDRLPDDGMQRRLFTHYIHGPSKLLGCDSTGRVSLPDELLAHAGIERQALFLGLHERFQIWNPENYGAYKSAMDARLSQEREAMAAHIGLGLP